MLELFLKVQHQYQLVEVLEHQLKELTLYQLVLEQVKELKDKTQ